MEKKNYINYLKSFNNDKMNKSISLFEQNDICFDKLEMDASNNNYLTSRTYTKKIKIDTMLKNVGYKKSGL